MLVISQLPFESRTVIILAQVEEVDMAKTGVFTSHIAGTISVSNQETKPWSS